MKQANGDSPLSIRRTVELQGNTLLRGLRGR